MLFLVLVTLSWLLYSDMCVAFRSWPTLHTLQNHNSRQICSPTVSLRLRCQADDSAIVAPTAMEVINFEGRGCVLVVNQGEYDHFLMEVTTIKCLLDDWMDLMTLTTFIYYYFVHLVGGFCI